MGKVLSILGGIIAVLLGIWGLKSWIGPFVKVLQGTIPAILILGGVIAFFAGVSEIKDSLREKKEEKKRKEEEKKEEKKEG